MPRTGTLIICVQNLDFSGANQVVLNIVSGSMHEGNVVVVSPRNGPIAHRFVEIGAAVRVGEVHATISDVSDPFLVVCNTIMCAGRSHCTYLCL